MSATVLDGLRDATKAFNEVSTEEVEDDEADTDDDDEDADAPTHTDACLPSLLHGERLV